MEKDSLVPNSTTYSSMCVSSGSDHRTGANVTISGTYEITASGPVTEEQMAFIARDVSAQFAADVHLIYHPDDPTVASSTLTLTKHPAERHAERAQASKEWFTRLDGDDSTEFMSRMDVKTPDVVPEVAKLSIRDESLPFIADIWALTHTYPPHDTDVNDLRVMMRAMSDGR